MTEIQSFLKNPTSFSFGLELLKKFDPENRQLPIIQLGESSFTWKKLLDALSGITITKPKSSKYNSEQKQNWPEHIALKYNRAIELIRERSLLHSKLYELIYNQSRKPSQKISSQLADEIISISAALDTVFYQIDYWVEHGKDAPGTQPKSKEEKINYWLSNQVNYHAYCRNTESRKTTANNELYTYRKAVLAEIEEYLCHITVKKP